jgi:hypothetical protein
MAETDVNEYNLSSNERKQSLKLSIQNNQQIKIVLINKETGQKYIASLTFNELRQLCQIFLFVKSIREAFLILQNTIEGGRIMLSEDPKGKDIIIQFNTNLQNKDYPPFDIRLLLNENTESAFPPKFYYSGNSQLQSKLPSRIQGFGRENFIQEQYNNQNFNNYQRSNSTVAKRKLTNSTNNFSQVKKLDTLQNGQLNNFNQSANQEIYQYQSNINYMINNNMNNKAFSDYSTMTFENRPFVVPQYGIQIPNPTLQNNNLNKTNFFQDLNKNHQNIIERRPRIINKNRSQNRALSTPSHENVRNFNQNQNIYQSNASNNPYQTNQIFTQNNNMKHPYDRNTQRVSGNQSININTINKNQFVNQGQEQLDFQGNNQKEIRQVQSFTAKKMPPTQPFKQQTSHEINPSKTQMFNQPINSQFRSKVSTPLPNQTPSLTQNNYEKQISQQQIALAQMASMQNQENPNFQNLAAITLNENIVNSGFQEEAQPEQNEQLEQQQLQQQQLEQQQQEEEPEEEQTELNIEALFITQEGKVIFRNGLLRGIIHKYAEIDDVVSRIQDILLKGVKFYLVYKAFDLDDKASTFHEKCDNLDMSLVLIETDNDARFGGFTTKSWKGNCIKKRDNNAFVFNLETNKIFEIIENEPAVGCYPKFGPVFFGCQIRIYNEFFSNGGSTCHRGLNYCTKEDFELTNGVQKYLVKDIEVYGLETIDIS